MHKVSCLSPQLQVLVHDGGLNGLYDYLGFEKAMPNSMSGQDCLTEWVKLLSEKDTLILCSSPFGGEPQPVELKYIELFTDAQIDDMSEIRFERMLRQTFSAPPRLRSCHNELSFGSAARHIG